MCPHPNKREFVSVAQSVTHTLSYMSQSSPHQRLHTSVQLGAVSHVAEFAYWSFKLSTQAGTSGSPFCINILRRTCLFHGIILSLEFSAAKGVIGVLALLFSYHL